MKSITINTKKQSKKISPLLYGIFFEDINYGGDGGLYAELIANRSFEYYDRDNITDKHKMCWESLIGTDFEIRTYRPINDIHTHYAHIVGKSKSGIRNTSYGGEGFASDINKTFIFSCYARADENTKLSAVIEDRKGKIFGKIEFDCADKEWHKYEFEIITNEKCKNAYLSIILPNGGEADLEFISLFPKETFKGRKNGMRKDIAEMIADMKPKFMRFPGGCIVEGRSYDNMYNWKDTIGSVEKRKTNWNRWQMEEYRNLGYNADDYFQSYGIGFFEYFQFCEDIGAKPIPVVNCGMTCQWHEALLIDTDKLEPFIQDVFDLIEFANGDENSEWGKKRIEMGHKEPFNLEYIGIGNEQWGKEYFERYEIFEKCITEKYPDIKLITSAGWKNRGWEYDLAYDWLSQNKDKAYAVDEHFYKEPEWFLDNINRYDDYDRRLPKVFIGEWAAHLDADKGSPIKDRKNNWYAALCEAAFLTGIENNADHVVMTCYAPLLAKENHNQWQPNLIWFDNETVYGTPSYYVQKLFSENIGDYAVEAVCEDTDLKITAAVKDDKLIVKIVNISAEDKTSELNVDRGIKETCKTISVSGKPDDENSIKYPVSICPSTQKLKSNVYEIKKQSVIIIELQLC